MTLIAALTLKSTPVLLADVLTTGRYVEKLDTQIPLPTLDLAKLEEAYQRYCEGYRQHSLCRKIFEVNNRLVVCWAGRLVDAKSVLGAVRLELGSNSIDLEGLRTMFERHMPSSACELVLLGWLVDGVPVSFKWSSTVPDKIDTGIDFVGGSGEKLFAELLREARCGDAPNGLQEAIALVCNLISAEIVSADTIYDAFGAGFEIYFYDGSGFRPIEDVLYLLWRVVYDPGVRCTYGPVPFSLHQYYQGDYLICEAGRGTVEAIGREGRSPLPVASSWTLHCESTDLFAISPLFPRGPAPVVARDPKRRPEYCGIALDGYAPSVDRLTGGIVIPTSDPDLFRHDFGPGGEIRGHFLSGQVPYKMLVYLASRVLEGSGFISALESGLDPGVLRNLRQTRPRLSEECRSWGELLFAEFDRTNEHSVLLGARRWFECALRLDPDDTASQLDLATCLGELSHREGSSNPADLREEACRLFAAITERDPAAHVAMMNWARLIEDQAKEVADSSVRRELRLKAATLWTNVLQTAPSWQAYLEFARLQLSLAQDRVGLEASAAKGYLAAARAAAMVALEINADAPDVIEELGLLAREHGVLTVGVEQASAFAEARKWFSRLGRTHPGAQWFNLACVHCLEGDLVACRELIERAVANQDRARERFALDDPALNSVREQVWFKELSARSESRHP